MDNHQAVSVKEESVGINMRRKEKKYKTFGEWCHAFLSLHDKNNWPCGKNIDVESYYDYFEDGDSPERAFADEVRLMQNATIKILVDK